MLHFIINIFKYTRLSGILIPFKTYIKAYITVRNNARLTLAGRLTIGNPNPKVVCISKAAANIYFGDNAEIQLGKSISIGPGVNIIVKNNAQLTIGDNTYFTSDMHIEAVNSIRIGNDCAISWGVTIIDDDHHKVLSAHTTDHQNGQVNIGHHVWIGCNATILKGVTIGNNCVVAAGSIVKGTFPDSVMIAGNPARIVRQNINWE